MLSVLAQRTRLMCRGGAGLLCQGLQGLCKPGSAVMSKSAGTAVTFCIRTTLVEHAAKIGSNPELTWRPLHADPAEGAVVAVPAVVALAEARVALAVAVALVQADLLGSRCRTAARRTRRTWQLHLHDSHVYIVTP